MENQGKVVVPVTLKGVNYLLWSRTIKTALCSRGLWGHVSKGEPPKEEVKKDADDMEMMVDVEESPWFQEDQMVLAIIQNSLEASLLEAYSYCETAKELHLLRAEKLPTLDDVCSQVQKEQGTHGLFGRKGDLVTANKSTYQGSRGEDRKVWFCEHCKKKGHLKEKCWLLHPHLKPNNKWKDPRGNVAAHEVNGDPGRADTSTKVLEGEVKALMTAQRDLVSKADLEAIIKAIKDSGNPIHSLLALKALKPLIVDSGASHHMISDSNLITDVEPAIGNVIIANGSKIPIEGVGNFRLFDKKSKAFYMPSFTSNLLSVKKATTDLNCLAIFSPNEVYFQDIKTSKVIGKGKTKDDLYLLEDTKSCSSCLVSVSPLSHLAK